MQLNSKIIVICGPTASGKSDVANLLAKQINGEVISADSMQIYKGMDIGTGKLPKSQRLAKHWGIDIVSQNKPYSAALFQKYSRDCFKKIKDAGKTPILCGGTGFYIRAAIDDYDFSADEQNENLIRAKYQQYLNKNGVHAL